MITTIILILPVFLIYQNIRGIIINELGKSAMSIASAAASFIEQDVESFKELTLKDNYVNGNYDRVYYEKMQETFRKIKGKTGVSFIFTEKKLSEREAVFIFDGEENGSKMFSQLGSINYISDAERRAFNEKLNISTDLINDSLWGAFISGFAPIIDANDGEVLGLVGVDFSLAYVKNIINSVKAILLTSIFIIVFLITVIVNKILEMRTKSLETDYLTGLYSKNYYEDELDFIIKDSKSKGKIFSLVMIDIDDFKEINDQRGHIIGDKVLKSVAKIMQQNMRSVDICSRYGGDEFIVILPETTKEHAVLISERILDRISNLDFSNEGIDINMSLSIGIAEWKSYMTSENLIECADKAMYISKNTGKNKVTVYTDN
nr:diguanylate cyclase [Sedimentibacter sp.]